MSKQSAAVATPAPGPVTTYVVYNDGSAEKTVHRGSVPVDHVLVKPGRIVDEAQYAAAVAQIEAVSRTHREEQDRAGQLRKKDDYTALVTAGIPEAVARRLTRYRGV